MSEYRFDIGSIECLIIKDGGGPRAAISFLSEAPLDELERVIRALNLDPNTLDFSINILLIKTGSHTILVDTGLGNSDLPGKLKAQGVDSAAIDTVIITHGHSDHINGILNTAGEFVYPNARYCVSKAEWESSITPPTTHAIWNALLAHQDRVTVLDTSAGEAQVAPGVYLVNTPGHTPGHSAVRLESDGEQLLHIVDAAHHYFQLARTEWSPNFDFDKRQAAATRQRVFEYAAQQNCWVLAYHFTFPGIGKASQQDGVMRWQPREQN